MFEAIFPIPFLVLGFLMTFKREKFAGWWCSMGKAIWRLNTFGFTDMSGFYQEDKAKRTFRLLGPCFLFAGLLACGWTYFSFIGPGSLCAMREGRLYLEKQYGFSSSWKLSVGPANSDDSVDVTYRYGDHTGNLHCIWQDQHYDFSEVLPTLPLAK